MPRNRLRTFTLWTGTTLSLLIAAAFVVSARWKIVFQVPRSPALRLIAGSAIFVSGEIEMPPPGFVLVVDRPKP